MDVLVLGPIEVRVDDNTEVVISGARRRALLARLALDAGRPVPAERLVDELWDGAPPPAAASTIQSHVSNLRKLLGHDRVITTGRGYVLDVRPEDVDAARFEADLREATAAAPEVAAPLLERALSRWRGDAYADANGASWATAEVHRLNELRLIAVESLLDARLSMGQHDVVVALAEAEVVRHPLRERLWALLMTALYRAGRQADALRAFRRLGETLAEELGISPSPELVELEARILRQDVSLAAPTPARAPTATPAPPSALPSGVVTFLLTDVVGSTRLWERDPSAMADALVLHDELVAAVVSAHGGVVLKARGEGDSTFSVFRRTSDAVAAAIAAREALSAAGWPTSEPLRVRMAVHTGEAVERDGDYYGPTVNRVARLRAIGAPSQILVSATAAAVVVDRLPDGARLVALGPQELRDLDRPENVYVVVTANDDVPAPPPRHATAEATSFVGRDDDLKRLGDLLERCRLVTITGAGGVGKTRLAAQLAANVAERLRDGTITCELAAAGDRDTLEQVVASAVGATARAGATLTEAIVEQLRSQQVLVVLDNCEHLLDAASDVASAILRECRDVRVVATSREMLAVDGEQAYALRPLAVPERDALPEAVLDAPAGRLFVDRARSVRPEFAVTAENAGAIGDVCRRLDGMALAIELAAARVGSMSPSEIAGRLDERFRLLTGGRRNAVERHQTLRAAVDWSYSLLDERDRRVFDRLGVFAGSFDAHAAEAVAGGDGVDAWDVVDALDDLVAKSMVTAEVAPDGSTRYQLLETLRRYALERLEAQGDVDEARRRHAQHYAAFAEGALRVLHTAGELAMRRRLHAELDNLRAAVFWALESEREGDVDLAVAIVAHLGHEIAQSKWAGIGAWAEAVAAAIGPPGPDPSPLHVGVVLAVALHAMYAGDYDRGRSLIEPFLREGLPPETPSPLNLYIVAAVSSVAAGDLDGALDVLARAHAALPPEDAYGHSNVDSVAAVLAGVRGAPDRATAVATRAVESAERLGAPTQIAIARYAHGVAFAGVDPDAARRSLRESVALTDAGAGDTVLIYTLGLLTHLELENGDRAEAARVAREAVIRSRKVSLLAEFVDAVAAASRVLVGFGRYAAVAAGVGMIEAQGYYSIDAAAAPRAAAMRAAVEAGLGAEAEAAIARGAAMSRDALRELLLAELDAALATSEATTDGP